MTFLAIQYPHCDSEHVIKRDKQRVRSATRPEHGVCQRHDIVIGVCQLLGLWTGGVKWPSPLLEHDPFSYPVCQELVY
jgi:hypothetical protein